MQIIVCASIIITPQSFLKQLISKSMETFILFNEFLSAYGFLLFSKVDLNKPNKLKNDSASVCVTPRH